MSGWTLEERGPVWPMVLVVLFRCAGMVVVWWFFGWWPLVPSLVMAVVFVPLVRLTRPPSRYFESLEEVRQAISIMQFGKPQR